MVHIVASDNLNRDYHPDKFVASFHDADYAKEWCEDHNRKDHNAFFHTINSLAQMDFSSMYDCNGITPSFKEFCTMTNLHDVPEAKQLYTDYYQIQGDLPHVSDSTPMGTDL